MYRICSDMTKDYKTLKRYFQLPVSWYNNNEYAKYIHKFFLKFHKHKWSLGSSSYSLNAIFVNICCSFSLCNSLCKYVQEERCKYVWCLFHYCPTEISIIICLKFYVLWYKEVNPIFYFGLGQSVQNCCTLIRKTVILCTLCNSKHENNPKHYHLVCEHLCNVTLKFMLVLMVFMY